MISTTIQVRGEKLVGQFLGQLSKDFPDVVARALNRTAEEANVALQKHISSVFHVRVPSLLNFLAPTKLPRDQQANPKTLSVILSPTKAGQLFNPFETGTPHTTGALGQPVAVPTSNLRPTIAALVPRKMYPINLGLTPRKDAGGTFYYAAGRGARARRLTPRHITSRGVVQLKGKMRTFVLDPTNMRGVRPAAGGIWQRIGPGKKDIIHIWSYKAEVPRPPVLHFEQTIAEVVAARWEINFMGYWNLLKSLG